MKYLLTFELFEAKRAPNQLKRAILDFIAKNPRCSESEIKKRINRKWRFRRYDHIK